MPAFSVRYTAPKSISFAIPYGPNMAGRDFTSRYLQLWNGVNRGLKQLCEKECWLFLGGVLEAVADPKAPHSLMADITTDGVHLDHRGYELLGKAMASGLRGKLRKGQTALMFGDSITAGYPFYEPVLMPGHGDPTHSYGHWLEKVLGITAVNMGVSGDTTYGILQRFRSDGSNADMAIFQGGGNDAIERLLIEDPMQTADKIVQNFEGMGSAASARKMSVALVPLLPFDPEWG